MEEALVKLPLRLVMIQSFQGLELLVLVFFEHTEQKALDLTQSCQYKVRGLRVD